MAADVADFIREHGLKDPTLIGHSMYSMTPCPRLTTRSPDTTTGAPKQP